VIAHFRDDGEHIVGICIAVVDQHDPDDRGLPRLQDSISVAAGGIVDYGPAHHLQIGILPWCTFLFAGGIRPGR